MTIKRLVCVLAVLTVIGSASLFADWYVPLDQVPAAVLNTARTTYPQAQIWYVEVEHYSFNGTTPTPAVYEVKMSNFMELYIDANGTLLGQKWDD